MSFPWTCPYCHRDTTITNADHYQGTVNCNIPDSQEFYPRLMGKFIICPNQKCKQLTLFCTLLYYNQYGAKIDAIFGDKSWQLLPPSSAKPLPDYIPSAIRQDYEEACLIKSMSPKASATMARRCLQGMIRDFWEVKEKNNLAQEINSIKDRVDADVWGAIDDVRKLGNIGAHMEKGVDRIIDIDPQEADSLIKLIEYLFKEWYINRHERAEQIKALKEMASTKEKQRKNQNDNS